MKKLFLLLSFSIISAMSHAIVDDGLKDILLGCDPHLTKSLNGIWQLKVASGISNDKKVPKPDMSWGSIPVPGCWEAYGFCQPKYDYPDSLTGYYRTTFTVPKAWKDKRVILRFDGVLHSYDLWINGKEVGNWNKAFNTCLFDITPFLSNNVYSGEPQELAMRVTSRPTGYEFDCFDDWAPSGIFRDVTLFPVPDTHLADYMVETRQLKGNNAQMRFSFKVFNPKSTTHLRISIFSPFGAPVGTPVILNLDRDDKVIYETNVSDASLWTAETPNLYTIKAELMNKKKILQTMTKKFGIRQMTIEGNIVKINDKPIKFRGVNAHSTDPFTVKVINDTLTLKDMKLMKEASVNYIRTSHYPREPRFYELADSLGFYVVSEVPFCYGDKHLTDTTYLPNLLERAHATVNRDKSHACIMIWSIGNENPFTKMEKLVGAEVKRVDSSRPICFPQRGSTFRSLMKKGNPFPEFIDIYAPHYPSVGTLNTFFQHQERPVLFTEYCHSVGGSFEDHDKMWEIIQNSPGILGGSVWEWADQGIPFKAQLKDRYGVEHRVFTSSHGGFEMNGNKGTDGMVYANRIPLPNYYELQHNYAQAAVLDTILHYDATTSSIKLNICNRFDFTNLKDESTLKSPDQDHVS
jgi:beta-galactosidase